MKIYFSTKFKIFLAKIIFSILKILSIKIKRLSKRGGINYHLDLSEGIDLSIFLLGSFEKKISLSIIKNLEISKNKTLFSIIDIGSNIGDKSLFLANEFYKKNYKFKIYSIEPTDYALKKQIKNLKVNSHLINHVDINQCIIQSDINNNVKQLFSSWRLDTKSEHPKLMGQKNIVGQNSLKISLDDFCKSKNIINLKAIKIDVDGYEFDVIKSGVNILKKYKPAIFVEYSEYLMQEIDKNFSKEGFITLVSKLGYKVFSLSNELINLYKVKPNTTLNLILK